MLFYWLGRLYSSYPGYFFAKNMLPSYIRMLAHSALVLRGKDGAVLCVRISLHGKDWAEAALRGYTL